MAGGKEPCVGAVVYEKRADLQPTQLCATWTQKCSTHLDLDPVACG